MKPPAGFQFSQRQMRRAPIYLERLVTGLVVRIVHQLKCVSGPMPRSGFGTVRIIIPVAGVRKKMKIRVIFRSIGHCYLRAIWQPIKIADFNFVYISHVGPI